MTAADEGGGQQPLGAFEEEGSGGAKEAAGRQPQREGEDGRRLVGRRAESGQPQDVGALLARGGEASAPVPCREGEPGRDGNGLRQCFGVHDKPAGVRKIAPFPDEGRLIGAAGRRRGAEGVNHDPFNDSVPVGGDGLALQRRKVGRPSRGRVAGARACEAPGQEREEKGPEKRAARFGALRHGAVRHACITFLAGGSRKEPGPLPYLRSNGFWTMGLLSPPRVNGWAP